MIIGFIDDLISKVGNVRVIWVSGSKTGGQKKVKELTRDLQQRNVPVITKDMSEFISMVSNGWGDKEPPTILVMDDHGNATNAINSLYEIVLQSQHKQIAVICLSHQQYALRSSTKFPALKAQAHEHVLMTNSQSLKFAQHAISDPALGLTDEQRMRVKDIFKNVQDSTAQNRMKTAAQALKQYQQWIIISNDGKMFGTDFKLI